MELQKKIKELISKFFHQPIIDNFIRRLLIPNIIFLYLHFVHKTSKIIRINSENYEKLKIGNKKLVFGCWHGQQFSSLYFHRNNNIVVLVSPSRDGDVQDAFLKKFGYLTIRGSSNKQPVKSIIAMIRAAKKDGNPFGCGKKIISTKQL